MAKLVSLLASSGRWDFFWKLCMVVIAGNLLAMLVVYSVHGYFPSGLDGQLIETTIVAVPFVYMFLKVIGHLYALQTRLADMANTDVLTELPNRRAFLEALRAHIDETGLGYVFLVDADHFKMVNDTYGHDGGDVGLQAIAAHLRACVGSEGFVARIGGEEFAVLLPDAGEQVARRMGGRLITPVTFHPRGEDGTLQTARLTLSTGAVSLDIAMNASQALSIADKMLYAAKKGGRARCEISDHTQLPDHAIPRVPPQVHGSAA